MIERIVTKVLEGYGIDQKMVDKIKSVVDNIEVNESEEDIEINISLKNIRVRIKKNKEGDG
jgi:hypothetical protein